jgi:hypothetical protein
MRVLTQISKNGLGCSGLVGTPTLLVGTRVMRGADVDAIRKAMEDQANWPGR